MWRSSSFRLIGRCDYSLFIHPPSHPPAQSIKMAGKYAFTKSLKELRFLHCQTSEHSNAVRYVVFLHYRPNERILI